MISRPVRGRLVRIVPAAAALLVCTALHAAGNVSSEHFSIDGLPPLRVGQDPAIVAESVLAMGAGRPNQGVLEGFRAQSVAGRADSAKVVNLRRELGGVPVYGEWAAVVVDADNLPRTVQLQLALDADRVASFRARAEGFGWPADSAPGQRRWFPAGEDLIPALLQYRVERTATGPVMFATLRSATDGRLLKKSSVTDHAAFGYTVYADDSGEPFDDPFGFVQPHPTGAPTGYIPAAVEPQNTVLVEERSLDEDDPWLPDGATETSGNNVDVFYNSLLLPDGSYDFSFEPGGAWGPALQPADGDFRAQAVGGVFDYPYDHASAPADFVQLPWDPVPAAPDPADPQLNAKLVQAFYMANYLHDFWYDAGFTEAAGNAQQDNYGRGGLDGDAMIVHGGMYATFISTPGDGEAPVMTLGINLRSTTHKDAAFDWSIFTHEWTHYMVRRLVGGGVSLLDNNQGGSLNEGWADFVGMFMTVSAEDITGPGTPGLLSSYAVGSYMNLDYTFPYAVGSATHAPDAYFFGIRRWPYGPSNPLTFRHIEHGVPLPGPVSDFYDWKSRSRFNAELHTAGEIWANTLWGCARSIVANRPDRDFEANRRALARYLVEGMMATPPQPTFTEARDALLAVMRASDRDDYMLCRGAFASRGMGSGAVSPPRDSRAHHGVVESFENQDLALSLIESGLKDSALTVDADGVLDNIGERGELRVVLRNSGFETIRKLDVEVDASPDYEVGGRQRFRNIAPGEDVAAVFPVELLHLRDYDPTAFTLRFRAKGPRGHIRRNGTFAIEQRTNFDVNPFKGADTAEYPEVFERVWTQTAVSPRPYYADPRWQREVVGGNTVYSLGDRYAGYAIALVSPPLEVGSGGDFTIEFDHAYNFDDVVGTYGLQSKGSGFVQISTDGGATWTNVSDLGLGGSYNTESPAYPALVHETLNLGPTYAGSSVQVRFLLQSPEVFLPVEEKWMLDNILFQPVDNEPLAYVVPEDGF